MLYEHLGVDAAGHLTVGGLDTVALAERFGGSLSSAQAAAPHSPAPGTESSSGEGESRVVHPDA